MRNGFQPSRDDKNKHTYTASGRETSLAIRWHVCPECPPTKGCVQLAGWLSAVCVKTGAVSRHGDGLLLITAIHISEEHVQQISHGILGWEQKDRGM